MLVSSEYFSTTSGVGIIFKVSEFMFHVEPEFRPKYFQSLGAVWNFTALRSLGSLLVLVQIEFEFCVVFSLQWRSLFAPNLLFSNFKFPAVYLSAL